MTEMIEFEDDLDDVDGEVELPPTVKRYVFVGKC